MLPLYSFQKVNKDFYEFSTFSLLKICYSKFNKISFYESTRFINTQSGALIQRAEVAANDREQKRLGAKWTDFSK
jgi:hypothetical protein